MKNLITILLLVLSIACKGQPESKTPKQISIADTVILIDQRIQDFESTPDTSSTVSFEDSIKRYNSILLRIISSSEFRLLRESDLQKISDLSNLQISKSRDRKLIVVSWCVFNQYPSPSCSRVLIAGKTSEIISSNGSDGDEFGDNVQNDSIVQLFSSDGKSSYVLLGSNKCGNLCIHQMASVYNVNKGKIFKRTKVFYDGKISIDDVEFDYLINDQIKIEPRFTVKDNILTSPLFKADKSGVEGKKSYKIKI